MVSSFKETLHILFIQIYIRIRYEMRNSLNNYTVLGKQLAV